MTRRTALGVAIVLFLFEAFHASAQKSLSFDRSDLERTEDHSESLANDLLDLSVALRRRDIETVASYLSTRFEGEPFPVELGVSHREAPWITRHDWKRIGPTSRSGRDAFLRSLESFLSRFTFVEDVRLKVKEATFGNDSGGITGDARVFCFVVARNGDGRREWVRGYVRARAELAEPRWQIARWEFESLTSMIAERDLFSEVTAPAGLSESVPPFGEPPNDGFVAHGVAVADVDDDGLVDVLTTGVLGNRLFLNDGTGAFRDVSEPTLVGFSKEGTGALFLDYDNDGDQDVFMAAAGTQILLQNQLRPTGELLFLDVSEQVNVDHHAVGFSVAAADINRDGWTDLYVCSYNRYGQVMPNSWTRADNGTPNLLFVSDGKGRFREEALRWGVQDRRWSYAAAFADLDGDGRQDLYVANDFGENALFMNRGDRFEDEAEARGVLDPGNGMGTSIGDYDNDGDLDLHVTNMSSTAGNRILGRLMPEATADGEVLKKLAAGNSLFENLGDGTFRNVAARAGGFGAGWAWGGGFIDFDNDGREDTFTVNGFISGKTMDDT